VAPIHLAAWFGSLEILKLLVQAGAEHKVENEVKKQGALFCCFSFTGREKNICLKQKLAPPPALVD